MACIEDRRLAPGCCSCASDDRPEDGMAMVMARFAGSSPWPWTGPRRVGMKPGEAEAVGEEPWRGENGSGRAEHGGRRRIDGGSGSGSSSSSRSSNMT